MTETARLTTDPQHRHTTARHSPTGPGRGTLSSLLIPRLKGLTNDVIPVRKTFCGKFYTAYRTWHAPICKKHSLSWYASEIRGTGRAETVDKVHLFAIKRLLRLSNRTPSVIVYGESGRYPLAVSSQICSTKYWLRLLKLNQDRRPFGTYRCS